MDAVCLALLSVSCLCLSLYSFFLTRRVRLLEDFIDNVCRIMCDQLSEA